ncbi:heavy-metal-associated domain-containing protein [Desertivirga brevis]|uniref:heavy-metal-associated domain-containing protein n=1 Tax=Desertivirga brevis TaxID=2810310 RepID=UPI001A95F842|nr:heavy-metal-associated domain-containing protein [Pedobacter sp. SYSU D00873]
MKSITLFLVAFLTTIFTSGYAQLKTETFKVSGVCSMCKKKIETASKMAGVKSLVWNEETKMAKVAYDNKITSLESIQKNIAAAGYDTEKFKAENKVFKNLPECCQYERSHEGKK